MSQRFWRRLSLPGWIVAAVVAVLIAVGGGLSIRQYLLLENTIRIRHQGLDDWDLAQLQRQLLVFENALLRAREAPGPSDFSALRLQWDLVWSRVNIVTSGDTGRALRGLPADINKVPQVVELLEEVDADFPRLSSNPGTVLAAMLQRVSRAVVLNQETYGLIYAESTRRQVALKGTLQTLQLETIAIGGAFVAMVVLLIALIWRNLSGELHRAYRLMGELRTSEDRFRNLVEGSIQGIVIHRGGRPVFANPTFVRMFGYGSVEEVLDAGSINVFNAPEERVRMEDYCTRRLRGEAVPERYEFRGVRRDGSLIWLENFARVVTWEGEPAVQSTLFDITDRKHAEAELHASRTLLQSVIDTLPHWITVKDNGRRYLLVNRAMAEAHGYRVSDYLGRTLEAHPELIVAGHERTREAEGHVLATGERVEVPECELTRPDGEVEVRRQVKFPLRGETGAILGVIGWSEDITERKRHEEHLARAREQAERATRLKDKFVSLIAHDLRSPLGSQKLLLEMLDAPDLSPEDRAELRKLLRDKCDAMVAMIDELLKISRLQTGELAPERRFVNAAEITSVLFELRPIADRKGVRLVDEVPEDLRLYVDPSLFREVVQNLVHNAIKFSRRGDTVTLFAPPGETPGIAVRDTGQGIGPGLLDDLFRQDVKTTTTGTDGEPGTGLGLPLCSDIMVAHGGRLRVETEADEGSVFYAELPAMALRALVLDPDTGERAETAALLAGVGIAVDEAASPDDARGLLERSRPHIVLADVPGLGEEGFRFLERVKGDVQSYYLPVIVLGHDLTRAARERALRLGAEEALEKPCRPDRLLECMRRYLGFPPPA